MVSLGQLTSTEFETSVRNSFPFCTSRSAGHERARADHLALQACSLPRLLFWVPDVGLHKFSLRLGGVEPFCSFMGACYLCWCSPGTRRRRWPTLKSAAPDWRNVNYSNHLCSPV